jgi:hypothetical protein
MRFIISNQILFILKEKKKLGTFRKINSHLKLIYMFYQSEKIFQ